MEAGETLDVGVLGLQVQVHVNDETQLQYDVIGRPRGLLEQEHASSPARVTRPARPQPCSKPSRG